MPQLFDLGLLGRGFEAFLSQYIPIKWEMSAEECVFCSLIALFATLIFTSSLIAPIDGDIAALSRKIDANRATANLRMHVIARLIDETNRRLDVTDHQLSATFNATLMLVADLRYAIDGGCKNAVSEDDFTSQMMYITDRLSEMARDTEASMSSLSQRICINDRRLEAACLDQAHEVDCRDSEIIALKAGC